MNAEEGAPSSRLSSRVGLLVLLLFFISGATSLVYEVIWMRRISLVFGASQLAIATVLAAFMGGLAGGAWFGGRLADRKGSPLVIYAALELGIAAYALAFPWLTDALVTVYRALVSAEDVEFWTARVAHLVLMGGLLFLPTAAMGATLPLLVRTACDRVSRVGSWTGLLYGVNTLGAVVGTMTAGFILLPRFGVRSAELLAAGANLGVGLVALGAFRWASAGQGAVTHDDQEERAEVAALLELAPDPDLSPERRERWVRLVPWLLFGAGFCAMVYEVAWSRLLGLILGSSVYAFTLMLTAFLLGTALGAPAAALLLARRGSRPLRLLTVSLTLASLLAWLSHLGFGQLPYIYVDLYSLTAGRGDLVFPMQSLIALGVMTPVTFFLGMSFPLAVELVSPGVLRLGREVARLYLWNTLGAVAGALGAGFLLLPNLGIQRTLVLAVVVGLSLAAGVWMQRSVSPAKRSVGLLGFGGLIVLSLLFRPTWNPLVMSAGMYKYVSDLSDFSHESVRNYALSDFELLFYSEGTGAVVTVARSISNGNIWLANNGKVDASSKADLSTQLLLGHLPFLHRPDAETALVVGLGSGITVGSVTIEPELSRIDLLEIEPAVVTASHFFDDVNKRPLEDPRVRLIRNDARNHLVLYQQGYDVIINEPSNPWISGVSNLFTLEFLRLGSSRLTEDGVFCQWVQTYGMGKDDLRSLLRTFAAVFPHVLVYQVPGDADMVLIGAKQPLVAHREVFWDKPGRAADLLRIEAESADDLLVYARLDRGAVLELAGEVGLNTDDNVRIEFSAPLFLHYDTSGANEEMVQRYAKDPAELEGLRGP
jgi:spermidine synthase